MTDTAKEIGFIRSVFHGLGAFFFSNILINFCHLIGTELGFLTSDGISLLVFSLAGFGLGVYLALEYRNRRVYETTKVWCTVSITLACLMLVARLIDITIFIYSQ